MNEPSSSVLLSAAGLDYMTVNQQLTFSPGNMRQCADVPIMEDTIVETDETINLVATGVSLPPGGSISIGTGTSTVTIIDDDSELSADTGDVLSYFTDEPSLQTWWCVSSQHLLSVRTVDRQWCVSRLYPGL